MTFYPKILKNLEAAMTYCLVLSLITTAFHGFSTDAAQDAPDDSDVIAPSSDFSEVLSVTDPFECMRLQKILLAHLNNLLRTKMGSELRESIPDGASDSRRALILNSRNIDELIGLLNNLYKRYEKIATVKQDGIGYQGIYRCFEIIDIFECIRMHNLAVKQMAFHSFRDLKADLPKSEHDTKNRCEVEITSRDNSYECLRLQTDALMPTLKKLYEKFKEKNRKISTTTETLHLAHPDDSRKKVEYFVSAPKAHNGELPVLVFIHGHQSEQPTGGKIFIDRESVNYVKKGFLVASISQPGYGNSDGPADFCGPFTQSAVRAVITELKKRPDVNPNQIFLYGESRGAVVAAMVGAQDGTLKGLILDAGFYDLRKVTDQQTRDNFTNEVQGTLPSLTEAQLEEAMHLRSVSDWHAQLKSDVLMFHGARDPRAPFPSAMDFYYKLCDSDLYVNLHYFDCEHHTPDDKREYFIDIFLEERTK